MQQNHRWIFTTQIPVKLSKLDSWAGRSGTLERYGGSIHSAAKKSCGKQQSPVDLDNLLHESSMTR